jgi:translation initiation factor IF-3
MQYTGRAADKKSVDIHAALWYSRPRKQKLPASHRVNVVYAGRGTQVRVGVIAAGSLLGAFCLLRKRPLGRAEPTRARQSKRRCMDINNEPMINEEINDREVRLIGPGGEQLGVMPARAALQKAEEAGLDLVKIVPGARPPVCKLMDYDKHRFEQSKRERELRKNQRIVELKEVQLSATIEENDVQTKLKNAVKFLEAGDKVKVSIRFRGRQIAHTNIGMQIMMDFAKRIEEIGTIERRPLLEGRHMIMIIAPKAEKKSFAERAQERKAREEADQNDAAEKEAAKEQPKKKVKRESENMI